MFTSKIPSYFPLTLAVSMQRSKVWLRTGTWHCLNYDLDDLMNTLI
jgi:hypothetical protein